MPTGLTISYSAPTIAPSANRPSISGSRAGSPSPDQLMPKAKEFESLLLGQWLQGAESSFGSVPGAEDDKDAGNEQFKSFAVQQLAKDITNAGGIGIAALVAKALAKSSAPQNAALPSSTVASR